jgi:hypothetical protein
VSISLSIRTLLNGVRYCHSYFYIHFVHATGLVCFEYTYVELWNIFNRRLSVNQRLKQTNKQTNKTLLLRVRCTTRDNTFTDPDPKQPFYSRPHIYLSIRHCLVLQSSSDFSHVTISLISAAASSSYFVC